LHPTDRTQSMRGPGHCRLRAFGAAAAVLLALGAWAPRVTAGPVGNTMANGLALPMLRGVRGWAGINETTDTEPFLQAFINGQVVPYVNSCHVLLPDGEPDCEQIEGDCADSAAACEYIYATETLARGMQAPRTVGVRASWAARRSRAC
jgi:hypothetical protein